jgi:hypothetical protein
VAVVLHALQERLDRLRAEVEAVGLRREGIGLVDEEDAVERPADRAVGLDRGRADELADEAGPVDLDEVPALQQSHRPVHLREQPRDRGLPGARVAEEDEMLRGRDLRQAVLEALGLHLEEGDERAHLLLHRRQADERVQLVLELGEALLRLRLGPERVEPVRDPVGRRVAADVLAELLPERSEPAGDVLERIRHDGRVSRPCLLTWLTTCRPSLQQTPSRSRTAFGPSCSS